MISKTFEDIRLEPLMGKQWELAGFDSRMLPPGILVTGPNSFIGCHVVRKLKEEWTGPLHLLVRAPSRAEAVQKMQFAFRQWGLGEYDPGDDVFHLGDVLENNMGLPEAEFRHLARDTGSVIHLAMTPLYHLPYQHFKRVWIPELERMIAFCSDRHFPKALHYASSFNANFFQQEDDFKALNTNAWQSGYAGFKWVAARTLENAFRQGMKGAIYDIPLVIGTEKEGISPGHYSIWMILDIFLKTGFFFPFTFNVIPVDTLTGVMVANLKSETNGSAASFIRPFLREPVTDRLFARTAANLLGLEPAPASKVRESYPNKLRFDFMIPPNFDELMEKVNRLPAVFGPGFLTDTLPGTPLVFMSNLNRILAKKHEDAVNK